MTTDQSTPIQLPDWLAEAILEGDPVDGLLNKRNEERTVSAMYCMLERDGRPGQLVSAKIFNVSPRGIGIIARTPIKPGQVIQLSPGDGSNGTPVLAVVIHCTQTVQGYKVGCTYKPS